MRPSLAQPIYIKLMPSKLMLGFIIGVSIISIVILLYLPISVSIKLAVIALILASSTYFILRDSLLWLPWSWNAVEVDNKGQLKISNQRGEELNFKQASIMRALPQVILFNSTQNADEMRRLRVWLRWNKHSKLSQEDSAEALGT